MRVLVHRPRAEGEGTARALAAAGHEPLLAPVLSIEHHPVSAPAPPPDALVLTSAQALPSLSAEDVERLRHRPVFAVGAATARAATARGFRDVRTGAGEAEGLGALIRLTLPPGATLLHLAGRERKPTLGAMLAGRYRLEVREAYEARPCPAWPAATVTAIGEGHAQAALHFSRRSASLALDLARSSGVVAAYAALRHACLSDDAAAPLRQAGCHVAVSERPDEDSLLQAL